MAARAEAAAAMARSTSLPRKMSGTYTRRHPARIAAISIRKATGRPATAERALLASSGLAR